jgi:hypothetical protein
MNDKNSLLEVLKAELEFVLKGGYRKTARVPWRPQFIFQDSPTCLNFDPTKERKPCAECVLMTLIPEDKRKQTIPCRHIPLNSQGETIDWFYRAGTELELEAALIAWLNATIAQLEVGKAQAPPRQTNRAVCGM